MRLSLLKSAIAMPLALLVVGPPLLICAELYPLGGGWGYDCQNRGKSATAW